MVISHTKLAARTAHRGSGLALALLMLGVVADNENFSLSLDYLALVAHFLY